MIKLKNKKYHTVGTGPKSNRKIVENGKIDTLNTQFVFTNKYTLYSQGIICSP